MVLHKGRCMTIIAMVARRQLGGRRGATVTPPTVMVRCPLRLRNPGRGAVRGDMRHGDCYGGRGSNPEHAHCAVCRVEHRWGNRDRRALGVGLWIVHAARGAAVDHKLLSCDESRGAGVGQEERHLCDVVTAADTTCNECVGGQNQILARIEYKRKEYKHVVSCRHDVLLASMPTALS